MTANTGRRGLRWWEEALGLASDPDGLDDFDPGDDEGGDAVGQVDWRRNMRVTLGFLEHKRFFERCSKYTLSHYRQILDRFLVHLDGKPFERVTTNDVKKFFEPMDVGPSTLRVYRANLHTFFDYLVDEGVTKTNPVNRIPVPIEPKRNPRGLPDEDIVALLDACEDERERMICVLMVQQGLRRGEVASLDIADIDLLGTPPLMRVFGKGDKERTLPITDECLSVLKPYIGGRRWGKVIQNHKSGDGVRPGTIGRIFCEVRERTSVNAVPHMLRHTCAHGMIHAGAHPIDVQQTLGHDSLRTTQRYLPWQVGKLDEAMAGRTYLRPQPPEPAPA